MVYIHRLSFLWWCSSSEKTSQTGQLSCFWVFFFSLNVPPCLSRKPKRAESEIPSLPEAGPAELSFERQHGKINGHLLREPPGHAVLLPHSQTALGPVSSLLLAAAAGFACTVYFGRTFNPAQPSRSLCSLSPGCLKSWLNLKRQVEGMNPCF